MIAFELKKVVKHLFQSNLKVSYSVEFILKILLQLHKK